MNDEKDFPPPTNSGLIWFGNEPIRAGFSSVENLSPKGDLQEAATNLFSALHRLDAAGLKIIYARLLPEIGLGRAINDRLRKAAWRDTHARDPIPRRE